MKSLRCLLIYFFLLSFIPYNVFAGDPGGPYVLWVNLSNNTKIEKFLELRIEEVIKKGDESSLNFDALSTMEILFDERPKKLSKELVRKAVIKNDKISIKSLEKILKHRFGNFNDGFDGIIIYDEEKKPRFSLIERGIRDVFNSEIKSPKNPESIWDAFLYVIPEVKRKP